MGLYADEQRLVLSTVYRVWQMENCLSPVGKHEDHDRLYVPSVATTTCDLDIHEIGYLKDGRAIFVNTLYSCLATRSATHSFKAYWKPPFISKLAAEDRCHLNGMVIRDGCPMAAGLLNDGIHHLITVES